MNVSVIGLGLMGLPMARNLLKAGHSVTVYNRTRARSGLLVDDGAHIADTIAEAARNAIVVTMLSDDPALESVVYGEGKLLESLAPDSIHLSMSTISASLSERLTEAHRKAGQHFVAAPVFGRPDAAAAAKLFVVAAGDEAALTRCQPVFDAVGQRTFIMGTNPVSANVVKLSGNFLIAVVIQSLGEAFSLIRKYDIDPDAYLDLLTNTLFAAPVYKNYGNLIAHQQYEPAGFKLTLGLKDVRLALAAAEAKNVALPLGSLARDRLITALALGYENKDWASMAQIIAQNAGLE
jgi:3-hydroxyisobutyrate dehydrogenase-like beta-hydroxyacid dehydrogenase